MELVKWNRAKQSIIEAKSIDEVKSIIDKAEAMRVYAKQIGETLEMQNNIAEIKLRAQRRAGEMLRETITKGGDMRAKSMDTTSVELKDINISRDDSSKWQKIANLDEDKFEGVINEIKADGEELTSAFMINTAKKIEREIKIQAVRDGIEDGSLELPNGLFEVIVVDPPWQYHDDTVYDSEGFRGTTTYPTMTLNEIKDINLPSTDDCVLWLWTTHRFMRHSFELLDKWGFEEKAILTWVKNKMGVGRWLRSKSEFCIMAVKGKPMIQLTNQTTVLEANVGQHSEKPEEFYGMVDKLCVGRKLNYFARKKREGWESFGTLEGEK